MSQSWKIDGEYIEACSCDFLCPCITQNSTTPATHEFCKVAMSFAVQRGHFGDTTLDGVVFAVIAQSPAIMSQGNWALGLIVDETASEAQTAAIAAIASGQVGGPLAAIAGLVGEFRGVTRARIEFSADGHRRAVHIDGQLTQEVEGIPSLSAPGQCLAIDNTLHPANPRLNLALAVKNFIRSFGIEWDAPPRKTNGHFAPFSWAGAAS